MCDTQVMIQDGVVWFAKNSDREPSEPQLVVRLPAVRGDNTPSLQTTHISIPQIPDRHAVILSKPDWIWGAEMGANEHGVVIGNEAIFSKLKTHTPGLLGMDLLRLGLERGATAPQALQVICSLLEQYGQGGPAGYRDKSFCYDNSFIIADPTQAWVLETAGRHWVARQVRESAAISNCLTIGHEYDLHSQGLQAFATEQGYWDGRGDLNFAHSFDTRVLPYFSGAHRRLNSSRRCLRQAQRSTTDFLRMFAHLRQHVGAPISPGHVSPIRGSSGDICLHAAGFIRRSQTTGSMVSRLTPEASKHYLTGTSAPCLSLFRPAGFETDINYKIFHNDLHDARHSLWSRFEPLHRRALFNTRFRNQLRRSRDLCEQQLLQLDNPDADRLAEEWLEKQRHKIKDIPLKPNLTAAGLYWRRLNHMDGLLP